MKKKINVLDAPELELEFSDGKIINLVFDMEALSNFQNMENGMNELFKTTSMPEMCALIIFIGARGKNEGFTIDEARKIVSAMAPITITQIIDEFNESMGVAQNEVQQEIQKKMMQLFLNGQK